MSKTEDTKPLNEKPTSTKKKTTALGVFAIVIFIIFLTFPISYMFYKKYNDEIGLIHLISTIIVNLTSVSLFIYSYVKCMKNTCTNNNNLKISIINEHINFESKNKHVFYNEDLAVYNLFTSGGWKYFQIWIASTQQNVWKNILFTLVLVLIPTPGLPSTSYEKLLTFLSRLGCSSLLVYIIIGSPIYIVHEKNQYEDSNTVEKVEMILSIILLFLLIVASSVTNIRKKINKLFLTKF